MISLFSDRSPSFVRPMRMDHVPACVPIHAASFARGWAPDYVALRLQDRLQAPAPGVADPAQPLVGRAAARLGRTRLIDNLEIRLP